MTKSACITFILPWDDKFQFIIIGRKWLCFMYYMSCHVVYLNRIAFHVAASNIHGIFNI